MSSDGSPTPSPTNSSPVASSAPSGSMISREHRSASVGTGAMTRSESAESFDDTRSADHRPELRPERQDSTPSLRVPPDARDRSGSGPPSPKDESRASPLKDKRASPSPLKEKRTLSQRLSAKIFGSSKGGSGKPVTYYRDAFKKKAISKADALALQEEFRTQPPMWLLKFDEECVPPLEAFLHHTNARNEKSDSDVDILAELFRAIAIVATPSIRESVPGIFKPQFMQELIVQLNSKPLRPVVLGIFSELCESHKTGAQLLLTSLDHYAKSKELSSRFLPLTQCFMGSGGSTYDTPIELKLAAMILLNAIFANVDELEPRFSLRSELMNLGFQTTLKELQAASHEELAIQIDTFDEGLTDDYHMMLVRKKNVRALATVKKADAAHRPKNYLRVYLVNLHGVATCAVIPFAEKKMVKDIFESITNKHPVDNPSLFCISVDREGAHMWLESEDKYLMEDYNLAGEVIAEFKMKPWNVTVMAPDGDPHLISVDPYITVGDFIPQLTTKFSLPTSEEYGLMMTANNIDTWLLENKPIHSAGKLYEVGNVLQLQTKPKPLKVCKFKEDTCEVMQITGNTTIHHLLKQLATKFGVPESQVREYGVVLGAKGADGAFLEEPRTVASYGLADGMGAIRFVIRPVSYTVKLPDESTKSFSLLGNIPVKQAIVELADQLKIDVDEGYTLYSISADNEEKVLEDWKTLLDQGVRQGHALALKKDPSKKKKDWFTDSGTPMWEEKGDNVVYSTEEKPKPVPASGAIAASNSTGGSPATATAVKEREVKKEISCASLNRLVEYLTSEKEHDMDFVKAFLLTYRSFTTPEIFLKKLGERWLCPSSVDKGRQQVIKLRICTTITQWLDRIDDVAVLDLIGPFVEKHIHQDTSFESLAIRLRKTVEERKISAKQRVYNYQTPPPPVIPFRAPEPWCTIFDIDETEAARQLTLPLFELYSRIKPVELFNQSWNSAKLRHRSPNVCAVIEYFNKVAVWSATSLLQEPLLANRVKMMKHLIMISQSLRQLNNLHLLTAIISGLSNSAVLRLKWTRLKLPKQVLKIMEDLEALTNMEGSYRVFRRELEHVVLPCIPYVGVYLGDLTFIEEGNPDMKGDLINWDKRKLVHNIIAQIQKFQMVGYNLQKESLIDKYLQETLTKAPGMFKDDREMYAKSLLLEPRNAKREDIK